MRTISEGFTRMRVAPGLAVLASLTLLVSCGKKAEAPAQKAEAPVASDQAAPASPAKAAAAPVATQTSPPPSEGAPLLAYSYAFTIAAPADRLAELEKRHEAACIAASYKACIVMASSLERAQVGARSAHLELRASKAWVDAFRAGLSNDIKPLNGQINAAQVKAEDLTHEIVDTQAMVATKTALRDKLRSMIAVKGTKLSELVELETKLSEVQGEIDQQNAELAMNRERVAMSTLNMDYTSSGVDQLRQAFANFASVLMTGFVGLITVLGFVLPWAILGGAATLAWRWVQRRRAKKG